MFELHKSLDMINSTEERRVGRFEMFSTVISTVEVYDGYRPYETAIIRPHEDWVVVDAYDTKQEAIKGHNKWKVLLVTHRLPLTLKVCVNTELAELLQELRKGE